MNIASEHQQRIHVDALVIGGGQAGLAAAHALKNAGVGYLVVDAGAAVGDSWRRRYDALTLFTPRSVSGLPGMPLAGDPDGYATKDEFAEYLAQYAVEGGYPLETGTRITAMRHDGGLFEAAAEGGSTYATRAVIVATGGFQKPLVPSISTRFPPSVQQIHVSDFRNTTSVPEGPVLVVGDGASGRDAALALSGSHRVLLAKGRPRKLFPERILGRSTWWWAERLGLLRASSDSLLGRRMRRVDPFPNRSNDDPALVRKGVAVKPRLVAVDGANAVFEDGSREAVKAVVWATGYRDDLRWIDIARAFGTDGGILHQEGISPVPGLFFVGRPWQRNRASGLIAGVGDDAAFIVESLRRSLPEGA
ncbi:NAD(P)/FAD-dependent oxidoreductase [Shinella sp.]|uniref:flavin-containing monooxygenase n=1 Tax=Shinella sp. TaxID=1870904 RepID=UPI00289796F1|nr:NAD(P)/FAD-dependent oxidoreductase [Shinella sp.]